MCGGLSALYVYLYVYILYVLIHLLLISNLGTLIIILGKKKLGHREFK